MTLICNISKQRAESSCGWCRSTETCCSVFPSSYQQDATFLDLFISTNALHVSGDSSTHHQGHKSVHTVFRYGLPLLMLAASVDAILCSWCWAEEPPETCRASVEINKSRNVVSCWLEFVNIFVMYGRMNVKCRSYHKILLMYRVKYKSFRDFWPQRYSSRDGHAEGEHVNRGRDTPSFCSTLQMIDMFTLGDAADVNPVIRFLPHTCNACGRNFITGLTSAASPRVDISNTCKVEQKLGVSLPLLTCSPSAWPSRLLYRRGRKSRWDLWITLYSCVRRKHVGVPFKHYDIVQ